MTGRTTSTLASAIREAHPLKQGLKQILCATMAKATIIREAHPLKQGLKQGVGH